MLKQSGVILSEQLKTQGETMKAFALDILMQRMVNPRS